MRLWKSRAKLLERLILVAPQWAMRITAARCNTQHRDLTGTQVARARLLEERLPQCSQDMETEEGCVQHRSSGHHGTEAGRAWCF